ncbi:hypothetical protein B0J18DRAFT_478487 [Chaetomium sp. MPI-SDFR-AT-0129]|nr:hypothetical protein B0J18DRAFT_478487 [Chaetomium sp. MPI-SDFR-AT-0129]
MTTVALTTTTIITSFITTTLFATTTIFITTTTTIFTPTTIFTTTTITVNQQQICTPSPFSFASLPPSTGSRSSPASSPTYTPPPDTTAASHPVPQQAMPAGGTTQQTLTALNNTAEDVSDSIYTLNNGQPVAFVRQCTAGCDQQVDNSTETGCAEDEE